MAHVDALSRAIPVCTVDGSDVDLNIHMKSRDFCHKRIKNGIGGTRFTKFCFG